MSATASPTHQLVERLCNVHVGVRVDLEVSRHVFRGEASYVVRDPVTFQSHRLSVSDYQVFAALRDEVRLSEVFVGLCRADVLDAEQETDFYRFILRLTQLGLTNLPMGDGRAAYERFERRQASKRKNLLMSALFLRVPLVQPDAFLERTVGWYAPLFTRTALGLWLVAMAAGGYVVAAHWEEFVDPLTTMLTVQNLPVLWMLLVGLKTIHEFGHAYACKHFGGRVPEMGALFMMFTPCAYVDASASWGFPSVWHRLVVSLAGMYFESIAALVALAVWMATDEGLVHSSCQYAIILSTLVTVGFNANPLMNYDGYYVASDLSGIPNLRAQATAHMRSVLKRWFFGVDAPLPPTTRTCRIGLIAFGVASSIYKTGLILGICVMIAVKAPSAGLALALCYFGNAVYGMARQIVWYAGRSDETAHVRRRAVGALLTGAVGLIAALALVPLPGGVEAPGVVERQFDRVVYAAATGFMSHVDAEEGSVVASGAPLCSLENLDLKADVPQLEAEIDQLEVELQRLRREKHPDASTVQQRVFQARHALKLAQQDVAGLDSTAPVEGQIVNAQPLRQLGKLVRKGDPLATISAGPWVVEALLSADAMTDALPSVGRAAHVRLLGYGSQTLQGEVVQVGRASTRRVDDAALTQLGGGDIVVSQDTQAPDAPLFKVLVRLDNVDSRIVRHGMTALVQLDAERPTWGRYLYRRGLNLLSRLRLLG